MSFGHYKFPEKLSFFRLVKIVARFLGSEGTAGSRKTGRFAAMQHLTGRLDMHFVTSGAVYSENRVRATGKRGSYATRRKTEFICNSLVPPAIFATEGDCLNDG